ncbi:MAG TPA: ABC transporter permease, partial [Burkholderiaceae bacterium]|nr:ABC transporter permease [Burkholderiaceae bacterium]
MLLQSLRMTARDWRAGELRFLLVALIVAVAALASVGFFVDRMRTGLVRDAHQLLGADVVIVADQPINPAWRSEAQQRGLQVAETVSFPSMALVGGGDAAVSQLASIKAVTSAYPLRGHLSLAPIADPNDVSGVATHQIPASGTVWVDEALLLKLNIAVGSSLKLGEAEFKVAQVIAREPDRGASFANFAPRVMLQLPDLAATKLIQNGSRVSYRLLVAGEPAPVAAFDKWVQA